MESIDHLGKPAQLSCPECHGAMWEIGGAGQLRYRCHIGHAYTAEAMFAARNEEIENLLTTLLRAHRERGYMLRRMASTERIRRAGNLASELDFRAQDCERDAGLIERLIEKLARPADPVG